MFTFFCEFLFNVNESIWIMRLQRKLTFQENNSTFVPEVEKYDENLHEKTAEQGGTPIRYYFENLKISIPQIKLSVFTSNKLPLDLKVSC